MKNLFAGILLVSALLMMTPGTVLAQDTSSDTGTVQSVLLETDSTTGETSVLVTYTDADGASQTVRLSTDTAAGLGLVITDPTTGETIVKDGIVGTEVTIDPASVIGEPTSGEDPEHPVGSALADFFSGLLGVDYDTIMTYHEDGFGFGVMAQALWFSTELGGGTDTFTALLDAKKSGDYSSITLADGTTPRNWGDVVKSLKQGDNLGSIRSGHADSGANTVTTAEENGTDRASSASTTDQTGSGGPGGNTANGNGDKGNGHGNSGSHHGNGNGHRKP